MGAGSYSYITQFIARLSESHPLTEDEKLLISKNIEALFHLKEYRFDVYEIDKNIDEEDVSQVFVRINSAGTPLNQNNFILTLLSVHWDEGRKDIEAFCEASSAPAKTAASSYNSIGITVSPQDIIRTVMAYAFDRARLKYGYKLLRGADLEGRGSISRELRDKNFDTLKKKLPDVINVNNWHEFLKTVINAGYLTSSMISSDNAVFYTYSMYLIAKDRFNADYKSNMALTSLWFFYASLTSLYTGSFESTAESHLNVIQNCSSLEDYRRFIIDRVTERLTDDYFSITLPGSGNLTLSGSSKNAWCAYVASLNILGRKVLFSQSNILVSKLFEAGSDGKHKSLEKHHLFPKAYLKKEKGYTDKQINQTANCAYIDWHDNIKILDKAPEIYYPVICDGMTPEEITRMEDENALPHGWEKMNYDEFLTQRRKLMAAVIKQAFELLREKAKA